MLWNGNKIKNVEVLESVENYTYKVPLELIFTRFLELTMSFPELYPKEMVFYKQ